jgi:macrolide transport system ATP-binding/permease protein
MLLINAINVKKYYGDRLVLGFEELRVYKDDRIGIVGLNGAGKTTLMGILAGIILADEGNVKLYADYSYITQLGIAEENADDHLEKVFGVKDKEVDHLSGGEVTRKKIAAMLGKRSGILLADEPTCNLDLEGILLAEKKLAEFDGALLLISHDRELLDKLCTRIIEIEDGAINHYTGNYSAYMQQKEAVRKHKQAEYDKYVEERESLEQAVRILQGNAKKMKKAPNRMGNSEARLHKRSATEKQEKLHRSVSGIKTRLDKLTVREKPDETERMKLTFHMAENPVSKVLIRGEKINVVFGERILFKDLEFEILKGSKTALVGKNGAGKTTLIRMIVSEDERIKRASGLKIAYLSQDLSIINDNQTVLQNVLSVSYYPEWISRTILSQMLFNRDEVNKKAAALSGGERVKLSIAKLLVSDANLLILDEPTNYLDIYSMEAVEEVLKEYKGTMLFTSHDRRFVDNIADCKIVIDDCNAKVFYGNYADYISGTKDINTATKIRLNSKTEDEESLLKLRLTQVIGKLSMPGKDDDPAMLDEEFRSITAKLKELNRPR